MPKTIVITHNQLTHIKLFVQHAFHKLLRRELRQSLIEMEHNNIVDGSLRKFLEFLVECRQHFWLIVALQNLTRMAVESYNHRL